MGNYTLNIDNMLDYLSYSVSKGDHLHERLGIKDHRAQEVSQRAYDIVWDEIERDGDFETIEVMKTLLRVAKQEGYTDNECFFYLYWGFSEIDAHIHPAMEISFEPEPPEEGNLFLN